MAALLGTDLYQKQAASPKNPAARPNGQSVSGELVEFSAKYTILGSETSGDTLPIVTLPIGAILRPSSMQVSTDGVGGTSVVIASIGDAGSATRYSSTSVALTTAATNTAVTEAAANALAPYAIASEANRTVVATITHSGAPTAGKLIVIRGLYRMP